MTPRSRDLGASQEPGTSIPVEEPVAGFPQVLERARLVVTKAIRSALERIGAAHPDLGKHLAATIKRGYSCSYLAERARGRSWNV